MRPFCYYAVALSSVLLVIGQLTDPRDYSHLLTAVSVLASFVIAGVFVCRSIYRSTRSEKPEWLIAIPIAAAIVVFVPADCHLIYFSFCSNNTHIGNILIVVTLLLLGTLLKSQTDPKIKSDDKPFSK